MPSDPTALKLEIVTDVPDSAMVIFARSLAPDELAKRRAGVYPPCDKADPGGRPSG